MEGSGRGYQLRCCGCGAKYDDDGVRLDCDLAHPPALLRTVYQGKRFDPIPEPSMGRFRHWLPIAGELTTILTWIEQLNEVDTTGVEPMSSVVAMQLPMREDVVTDANCRERILANAPQATGGFFAVPKVVE